MKIIIVGAGAVGTIVADRLSSENHDVTLIESDPKVIEAAQSSLDAMIIQGNGASRAVLEQAGIDKTQIFIAVTNVDEINILACLQAERYGEKTTVARVRNTDYYDEEGRGFEGLDRMINPDLEAVEEIHELLMQPAATDIYEFADGRVQVIGARVGPGAAVTGKRLRDIEGEVGSRWALVAAITRDGKTLIPRGEDQLFEGDHVFLVGRPGRVQDALALLVEPRPRPSKVMIAGATRIGIRLAERLSREGVHCKLLEKDEERARWAVHRLAKVLVLHSEATEVDVLVAEGIDEMDGFVAVSNDEEMNLTASLLARHHGARKTVALIKRPNYVPLAQVIGIDAAVSPRLSLARAIMRYFRRGNVLSLTDLVDSDAEVLELQATEHCRLIDQPLATLDFPKGALVAAIIKPYQVVVPRGADVIEAGDRVLVFALPRAVRTVQKFFQQ